MITAAVEVGLPIGQKALRMGFVKVSAVDLREILGCEEIEQLENNTVRDQLRERIARKYPGKEVRVKDYGSDFRGELRGFSGWADVGLAWKVSCAVKLIPLDHYVDRVIPDAVLQRIQAARDCGVERFSVGVPELRRVEGDPVVVGILGGEMVLVGKW